MDTPLNTRIAKVIAAVTSASFLSIHIVMLILFTHCGVDPMARFNVFSIVFYLFSFIAIYKEWFRTYVVSVYLEVALHMTLAVLCVGWDSGFQITLIGINILIFFAEYVGRSIGVKAVSGLSLSIVGMCMYLAALEISHYFPAPYALPSDVSFWLQIAWGIIVFIIDLAVLQIFMLAVFSSEKSLSEKMSHDSLTKLPNRYHLSQFLKRAKTDGMLEHYWIAVADIDDFKAINDTYGHNCGDHVLKQLAEIMTEGEVCTELCRWGGEEFVMLGPIGNGMSSVYDKLDGLRQTVQSQQFWYKDYKFFVTITIGLASYKDNYSVDEWINVADSKLYQGKCNGKNQVVY